MAAVSMMSSAEVGMNDFSQDDDGYFTCAVSVQHKVRLRPDSIEYRLLDIGNKISDENRS